MGRVAKTMFWGLIITGLAAYAYMVSPPVSVQDIYFKVSESVTQIHGYGGSGSAFLVKTKSGKKVLVTNEHVCRLATNGKLDITVGAINGVPVNAHVKIIAESSTHDLCALEDMADSYLVPLELGGEVGAYDRVFVVGFPLMPLMTVTDGNVSGFGPFSIPMPDLDEETCVGSKYRWVQAAVDEITDDTEAPLVMSERVCALYGTAMYTTAVGDFGNSGGPTLDESGRVVGVAFAVRGNSSMVMVVPLSELVAFLESL